MSTTMYVQLGDDTPIRLGPVLDRRDAETQLRATHANDIRLAPGGRVVASVTGATVYVGRWWWAS